MTITGRQLRDARSRAQLSQEELADLLGVTHRTVGNWERGKVPAGREALIRDKIGPYLKPEGAPNPAVDPLHQYSDTALVAEIARRLDAARGKGGQSGWVAPGSSEENVTKPTRMADYKRQRLDDQALPPSQAADDEQYDEDGLD